MRIPRPVVVVSAVIALAIGTTVGYLKGNMGPARDTSGSDLTSRDRHGIAPATKALKLTGFAEARALAPELAGLSATQLRTLLRDGKKGVLAESMLVWQLARRDPQQAYGFVVKFREGRKQRELMGLVMEAWVRRHPTDALTAARWITDPQLRDSAFKDAVVALADQQSLQAVFKLTSALTLPGKSLETPLKAWLRRDPLNPETTAFLLNKGDPEHLAWQAEVIGSAAPDQALEWLKALDPTSQASSRALDALDSSGIFLRPEWLVFARSLPPDHPHYAKASRAILQRGILAPEEARAWLLAMPPGKARSEAIADHLSLFEPSDAADLAIGSAARQAWSYLGDLRRSLKPEWVSGWPAGPFRDDAYRMLGQGSRGPDFRRASDAVATAGPGDIPPAYAEGLAIRYAAEPSARALAWLERVPADVREISFRSYFSTVGERDPVGASALLPQLPDDPLLRATATKAVADSWLESGEEPGKLSDWLGGISAPAEAAAAAQALAEARIRTGFAEQDRARLLSLLSH